MGWVGRMAHAGDIALKRDPKKRTDLHYEILRVDWKRYEDAGTDTNTPR